MISVILPVYNGALFLEKCLDSIVNQNIGMENIEIVAIDDVSTDSSVDILESYKEKYPDNIVIIRRTVQAMDAGESSRNQGVEISRGKYIMFVDQDDWYERDAFKTLEGLMENNYDLDFIEYGFKYTDNNGVPFKEQHVQENGFHIYRVIDESDRIQHAKKGLLPASTFVWTKIYRKSFLINYDIEDNGQYYADNFFSGLVNLYCQNYAKLDRLFLNYRNYQGSSSHKNKKNDFFIFSRCKIAMALYKECCIRNLLVSKYQFIEYIFCNTYLVKPFWRLLFQFDPIPYEELENMRKTINKLFPNLKENLIIATKSHMLEIICHLDKEWTSEYIDYIYEEKKRWYKHQNKTFNIFLGY